MAGSLGFQGPPVADDLIAWLRRVGYREAADQIDAIGREAATDQLLVLLQSALFTAWHRHSNGEDMSAVRQTVRALGALTGSNG